MGFIGRKLLVAALLLGTIGGFTSGFCSVRRHHNARRAAFERHVADVCLEAVERRQKGARAFEE
jgi:hypothetical protein